MNPVMCTYCSMLSLQPCNSLALAEGCVKFTDRRSLNLRKPLLFTEVQVGDVVTISRPCSVGAVGWVEKYIGRVLTVNGMLGTMSPTAKRIEMAVNPEHGTDLDAARMPVEFEFRHVVSLVPNTMVKGGAA